MPGVFACGNVLHVHDLVDFVTFESLLAGQFAGEWAQGMRRPIDNIRLVPGDNVRYCMPHTLSPERAHTIYLRCKEAMKPCKIRVGDLMEKKLRFVVPAEMIMLKIKPEEIKVLSNYIYNVSGISIDASKAYLLETRFGKLLDEEGCSSYSEFYHKAKTDVRKVLEQKIINAITTNETLFFRDTSPFELLKHKILPDLIDSRTGKGGRQGGANLKIWSKKNSITVFSKKNCYFSIRTSKMF